MSTEQKFDAYVHVDIDFYGREGELIDGYGQSYEKGEAHFIPPIGSIVRWATHRGVVERIETSIVDDPGGEFSVQIMVRSL